MNELTTHLIEAARKNPPSDVVPVGFEKQVMAGVRALNRTKQAGPQVAAADAWAVWTRTILRATWSGAALALVLSVGSFELVGSDGDEVDSPGLTVDSMAVPLDDTGGDIL